MGGNGLTLASAKLTAGNGSLRHRQGPNPNSIFTNSSPFAGAPAYDLDF